MSPLGVRDLVRSTLHAGRDRGHHCGRRARCGHCGHGHARPSTGAILNACARARDDPGRQFLLLQVLIVLAVLIAVGAISVAQTARTFERRSSGRRGAPPRTSPRNPLVRQGISTAEPGAGSRPGHGRRVGAHRLGLDSACCSPTPTRIVAGLLRPGARSGTRLDAGQRPGARGGASWTGTQEPAAARVVVAQVPVYDLDGAGRRRRLGRQRDVPVGRGPGSATSPPTCSSTSAWPARSGSAARCCSPAGSSGRPSAWSRPRSPALVEHREALVHGVKEGVSPWTARAG